MPSKKSISFCDSGVQGLYALAKQQGDLAYLIVGLFIGGFVASIVAGSIKRLDTDSAFGMVVVGAVLGMAISIGGVQWLRMVEAKEKTLRDRKLQMYLPPEPPTQIVGRDCTLCSIKIVFELDGSFCHRCHRAFCDKCKNKRTLCDDCG